MDIIVYAAGALLYGALYLIFVAGFGYLLGKPEASILAIADMGLTYLAFNFCIWSSSAHERSWVNNLADILVLITIGLGIAAGLNLL